ncbi:hypothetical protein [Polyangium aurulentum]|uniref:hypothetical protein n=1 Tax=Polyangium aurulentum TaxID=2567896 RepID=UPI0010AEAFE0|nr:hypothetical protein [Polyangium aurulentum]UQA59624.1 hypothetical protein E8A73_003705 [Polyangium aurulentum]
MRTALAIAAVAAAGCTAPAYGDMPARCADGACPEGYDCIHGVCALPGTPVPITVTTVPFYMRGSDMRLVPQASTALVVWETYPYSSEGQRVVGARVAADGAVSPRMDLVASFTADPGAVEPYFDALAMPNDQLLVAISAAPTPDDDLIEPRLITYRVDLPPEGQEAVEAPSYGPAWTEEKRMSTTGYGAVSSPRLVDRGDRIDLGYVRSLIETEQTGVETVAELSVFGLGKDGSLLADAEEAFAARAGLPVAVGVLDVFRVDGGTWWILDDERPSSVHTFDAGGDREVQLERLAIPVAADASSLTYIKPSARTGDQQPTDPVKDPAELRRVTLPMMGDPGPHTDEKLGDLPTIRDTPRPAWINRAGAPAILVTPGKDIDAPELGIYLVDPDTGATSLASSIPRLSSVSLEAVRAQLIGGQLFVAWVETDLTSSTIRVAIVPEPK